MLIKGLVDEDFVNYKVPSMYICTNTCSFKCDKENGTGCCQNSPLVKSPSIDEPCEKIIQRYLANDITKAIVIGGLEPFDQFEDVYELIKKLRCEYACDATVVIYTGFYETEISSMIDALKPLRNIVVKFGRYIPNQEKKYDDVLGVFLASPNQYAKEIC